LKEIALHQYDIEKIENLDVYCRNLEILLLQNNQISKIGFFYFFFFFKKKKEHSKNIFIHINYKNYNYYLLILFINYLITIY